MDKALISGIVVVGKRVDDLAELGKSYVEALRASGRPFELIFVLDGNKPGELKALASLQALERRITIVKLSRSFGESTALMSGFDVSSGRIIVTLPAYHQVTPEAITSLLEGFGEEDMIVARRWPRRGSRFEHARRRVFHWLIKAITKMRFRDLGCSVRVLHRKVLDELRLYGDQHRFFAVLASNSGFKVREVDAQQSEKDDYRSRYRVREYLHRLLDIFTIFFLIRFTKKPLRFFGMIGSIIFVAGGAILSILVIQRLFLGVALADRPAMLLSSLLVVLGLQLFSLGLLGELIIFTHARSLKEYKIDKIIGGEGEAGNAGKSTERSVA